MSLENKEIRGINLRQAATYTAIVVSVALVYFDLRNNTLKNREVLQEFKSDLKDQARITEVRLKDIENTQRTTDIRLTVMETQMKNNP